jgi:hypothetical protein
MEPTLAPTPSPSNSAQPSSGIYTLVIVFVAVGAIGVCCWLARKCQRAQVVADGHRGAGSSYVLWRGRDALPRELGDDETVDENMDEDDIEDVEAELHVHISSI